jgi:ABC-type transport system involved in cytochrome bd biosynthesis fused ATPase/permease subunit
VEIMQLTEVIFLDEPTTGLDSTTSYDVSTQREGVKELHIDLLVVSFGKGREELSEGIQTRMSHAHVLTSVYIYIYIYIYIYACLFYSVS